MAIIYYAAPLVNSTQPAGGFRFRQLVIGRLKQPSARYCSSVGLSVHCRAATNLASGLLAGIQKAIGQGQREEMQTDPDELRPVSPFLDTAPSWEQLQVAIDRRQGQLSIPVPDLEAGPANSQALLRTFGKPGQPRVKLYSAAWCPYCEKVWLQLETKQIPYSLEKVNMRCYGDKERSYLAKVPSGLLPAMELDGRVTIESDDIMRELEREFTDIPLLPPQGTSARDRANQLLRLERRLFDDWLRWLTSSWGNDSNRRRFVATMDMVNKDLGAEGGPFFLGSDISLVDLVFAPFLERIAASILYYKGLIVRGQGMRLNRKWPNLDRWFDSMEKQPVYIGVKSDFYTHVWDLPPQIGECASLPEAQAYADAIDGRDGKSWHLPLEPLSSSSLEPHAPGDDPPADRWKAAARLVENHEAVTKFAARGCGQEGDRPVWAPLSDPTAKAGLQHLEAVDAGLRHVADALLQGTDAKQASTSKLQIAQADGTSSCAGEPVYQSLVYMRDRIGVPRDLPLPAARQLRAHVNWVLSGLQI